MRWGPEPPNEQRFGLLKPHPTALVIDNDKAARRLLRAVLEPQGYRVLEAASGGLGLKEAVEHKPDVIILELILPDTDGINVLRMLREWNQTPVLVLSEQANDDAKVTALDSGATDYVTKPFSSAELLARLRVFQRPWPNVPDGPLLIEGELRVNLTTHEITLRGQALELTPKEEALFYILGRYAGKIVTREHLLRSVWGSYSADKIHDLQVLVAQLRKKLEPFGADTVIRTEGSLGYSLLLSARRNESALASGET